MAKHKINPGKIAAEAGAGVLTAAALVAGAAYLLSSKKQKAHAKAWVNKTRREVASSVRRAQRMSEAEYKRVVNQAVKRYGSLSNVNKTELKRVARDLQSEWKRLQRIARKTRPRKRNTQRSRPR